MICKECGEEKKQQAFSLCIPCYQKQYYQINTDKAKKTQKKWRDKNKERAVIKAKEWKENNLEKYKKYHKVWDLNHLNYNKEWILKNPKYHQRYMLNKEHSNINFKIRMNISNRIKASIKHQYGTKSNNTIKLLGCSIQKCREHLEKQFKEGMTWNNHGKWHIDHINPCANFDITKEEEQKKCFHYTNLQPLWAKENLSKSCKT